MRLPNPRLLLAVPAIALIFVFMILPITNMAEMSFRTTGTSEPFGEDYTLAHYSRIFGDAYYWGVLVRSLLTAATVTVLCLLVSYPIAWHMSKAKGMKAVFLYACIASPLMTGVLVRNFGWMIVAALNGPLNQTLMALERVASDWIRDFLDAMFVIPCCRGRFRGSEWANRILWHFESVLWLWWRRGTPTQRPRDNCVCPSSSSTTWSGASTRPGDWNPSGRVIRAAAS